MSVGLLLAAASRAAAAGGKAAPTAAPGASFPSIVHADLGAGGTAARDSAASGSLGGTIRTVLTPPVEFVDYLVNAAMPTEIASPGEAIAAWLADTFSMDEALRCAQLHGVAHDHFAAIANAARRKPELLDLLTLRNRAVLNDAQLDKATRRLGFVAEPERQLLPPLRFQVPGYTDLVRFAIREAFEPDQIKALGYNAEFADVQLAFFRSQGMDYPIFSGPLAAVVAEREGEMGLPAGTFRQKYLDELGFEPTWAHFYHWASWQLPSPTMAYEMLHRLREVEGQPGVARDPSGIVVGTDQVRRLLRSADYPEFWRDKMIAISYRLPSMRFLRVQLDQQTINEREASEQLQDMGYRPQLAKSMAKALAQEVEEVRNKELFRQVKGQIADNWELGLIDDDEFVRLHVEAGVGAPLAQAYLDAATAERNNHVGKHLIDEVHKSFLRGLWDWPQSETFLIQIGVVERRRGEYRRVWEAEKQSRRKEATAAQLTRYAVEGLVGIADMAQRLRNLGYADSAIELIVADVRLRQAERTRQALEKLAKEAERTERARLASLRAADQLLRQVRKDLAAHGSPAKLKAWYCQDLIDADDVTQRLRLLGWPQEDIDRLLGECDAKREKLGLPPYAQEGPGA